MSESLSLIKRASKQQTLTQNLMKLLFIKVYQRDHPRSIDDEIMEIIESFNATHIMLMSYSDNSSEVKESINRTHKAWMNFILSMYTKNIDTAVELNSIVIIEMNRLIYLLVEQQRENEIAG
jgi:hypothetical protein